MESVDDILLALVISIFFRNIFMYIMYHQSIKDAARIMFDNAINSKHGATKDVAFFMVD